MIEIRSLVFSREGKRVINKLDLSVQTGEKILIRGGIGTGKSTLFDLLLGFEEPLEGSIRICSEKVTSKVLGSKVSFIAQNNDLQLFSTTVAKEVEFIAQKPLDEETIEFFDLQSFLQRNPLTLSSSEKRRVLLAGVFLSDLPILIMDEPAADLDEHWKEKVFKKLTSSKSAVLVFSHEAIKGLEELRIEDLQNKDPEGD